MGVVDTLNELNEKTKRQSSLSLQDSETAVINIKELLPECPLENGLRVYYVIFTRNWNAGLL
jgi:hypothetical protein